MPALNKHLTTADKDFIKHSTMPTDWIVSQKGYNKRAVIDYRAQLKLKRKRAADPFAGCPITGF